MNGLLQRILLGSVLLLAFATLPAQEAGWPRSLAVNGGTVTIYPLQAESRDGDVVRYRAALAWRDSADAEPVFGAGWFESMVSIDEASNTVHPRDLRLTGLRFPDGTPELRTDISGALAKESPGWDLDYPLGELNSALAAAAAERESLQQLNTAPPAIVYRDHPALLVTLDGDPVLRAVEDSELEAVINTPYPLIHDGRRYYLNAMKDVWYSADRAAGPYRFEARPPAAVAALVQPDEAAAQAAPAEPVTAANAPEIVIATKPTELLVTDGPAVFVPLVDDLLVLQNSDDDVFMDVASQQYYIVLAGRWYRAGALNGPWTYQAADQLPPAFARIPPGSAQGDSRVYVAGTPEADEAVLDAQVPQTAAVERGPADVEVVYDGQPDFRPVDGTDMQYAANTGSSVLLSDRRYYLVEDGVWYVADNPNGPWVVSAWRPQDVAQIAPTSPVYNVKYVYVYDATPSVVYVGYTPGYLGNYVYYNTVVFGTGWYYRPWISPYYYYPRPSTWGFHVGYTPWYGWSFGLSWNWGWGWDWSPWYASYWSGGYWHQPYSWHHRHYGYWGPRGYRPRPVPYNHRGYGGDRYAHGAPSPRYDDHRGNDHRNDRAGYGDDRRDNRRDGRRDGGNGGYRGRQDNLYRDAGQQARVVNTRDNSRRSFTDRDFDPNGDLARSHDQRNGRRPASEAEPVSRADLRYKAQVRDAGQATIHSPRVVERGSKAGHKVGNTERVRQQPQQTPSLARADASQQAARTPPRQAAATEPVRSTQGPARQSAPGQREGRTVNMRNPAQSGERASRSVPQIQVPATVPRSRPSAESASPRQFAAQPAPPRATPSVSAHRAAPASVAAPTPRAAPSRSQPPVGAPPRADGPRGGAGQGGGRHNGVRSERH